MLKVLHCADIHLDSPFKSTNAGRSEIRRRELRSSFSSMMLYVKTNNIDIVLISGDLFDSEFVTKDTARFVAEEFSSCAPAKIIIAPGNHDPYTENSIYKTTEFSDNVYIFKDEYLGKLSFPELGTEVYGYAFTKNTMGTSPIIGKTPSATDMINLLCAHADVGQPLSPYCPTSESDIAASGFDYCAFGHVHGTEGVKKAGMTSYAYSGCLEGRDFGELGHKGAIYLEITKEHGIVSIKSSGLRFSKRRYEIEELDLSGSSDDSELIPKIKGAISDKYGSDTLLRLILKGSVSPSLRLDIKGLTESLSGDLFYLEITDRTLPLYASDALERDMSIRGAFFREMRPYLENGTPEERAAAARALRVGLAALSGEEI